MGLSGVFLGTVVSSICVPCWYRPVVVYKYAFHKPVKEYFSRYFLYLAVVLLNITLVTLIQYYIISPLFLSEYASFGMMMFVCLLVPNAVIVILFHRTEEFGYLVQLGKSLLERWKR